MKNVITYGTFDLLHYGHIEMFRRAKEMTEGGKLIVGVSTDDMNWKFKKKRAYMPYEKRKELVEAIKYVDQVIPEAEWDKQKRRDIQEYGINTFVIGDDWRGKFDELNDLCEVVYLPRTPLISSTSLRKIIAELESIEAKVS